MGVFVIEVQTVPLCNSVDLQEAGDAVPFEVNYAGQTCRAFAIRFEGKVYAYLNRCSHVGMELDWQPNRVFDATGRWLLCAAHGAAYQPDTGQCSAGPCRSGLINIELSEQGGMVYWYTTYKLKPVLL